MSVEHLIILLTGGSAGRRKKGPTATTRRADLLARRLTGPGKQWRFYDLGTRLQTQTSTPTTYADAGRAIGSTATPAIGPSTTLEYVELALDAPAVFTGVELAQDVPPGEVDPYSFFPQHVQIAPADPATVLSWDDAFLGIGNPLDPFGFSKYDYNLTPDTIPRQPARNIPHCLPLWYGWDDQPGVRNSEQIKIFCPDATAGYFRMSVTIAGRKGTSGKIPHNASAYEVKQALEAMKAPIGKGDIASASGNLIDGVTVVFGGKQANFDMPEFEIDNSNLVAGEAFYFILQDGTRSEPVNNYIDAFDPATYTISRGYSDDVFDLEAYTSGNSNIYPNATFRETVTDLVRWFRNVSFDESFLRQTFDAMVKILNGRWKGEDPRQTGEQWNTLNLTQHGTDISQDGFLEMGNASGRVNIRLTSRLAYESFDTGDKVNFKITAQPDFTSAEIPFQILHGEDVRFYLKPQSLCFAHRRTYRRTETFSYESYRYGTTLKYNRQTSDSAGDVYGNVEINPSMVLAQGQDPDAGPFTFTATLTINRITGVYVITGIPGGNINGTATLIGTIFSVDYWGPNYRITAEINQWIPANGAGTISRNYSFSTEPEYSLYTNNTISASCDLWRGAHVGRYPIFPRNLSFGGWSSMTLDSESSTTTYADGSSKTATFAGSVVKTGRQLRMNFIDRNTARQVYTRRSNRDADEIVYYTPIVYTDFDAETGNGTDRLFPATGIEWQQINPVASSYGSVDDDAATALDDLLLQIEDYNHARNVTVTNTTVTYGEPSFDRVWIGVPVDAQVGQLCAVIVTAKTKFYVWRKTAEIRSGYDWQRNQAVAPYTGNIT